MAPGKYKIPDGTRYFDAKDFYIGARLEISKHKFVLVDADEYAFLYMEKHGVCIEASTSCQIMWSSLLDCSSPTAT